MTRSILWVLWRLGVPIAAFSGGLAGAVPVAGLGLSVPGLIVGPLSLLTGALLAALFAGWVGNLASYGNTRSRLFAIFAASCAGAGAALVVGALLLSTIRPNLVSVLAICALILCGLTTVATWRFRDERVGRLGFDGLAALGICVVWVAVLMLVSGPGYLLGLVPAGFAVGLSTVPFVVVSLALAVVGILLTAWRSRRSHRSHRGLRGLQGLQGPQGLLEPGLGRDAAITLALVGLAPVVVGGVIFLGCQGLACGP